MTLPKKPSLSNVQDLERFSTHDDCNQLLQPSCEFKYTSNDSYAMMVLRLASGCTEDQIDRHFLRVALNLGINIPRSPKTTLELVTNNASKLALASDEPDDHQPSPSRISESTCLTSDSSSELKQPTTTSSLTTGSIASTTPSITSTSSRTSSYDKFKRGIRRLSVLRRRQTVDGEVRAIPLPASALETLRPRAQKRIATSDSFTSWTNVSPTTIDSSISSPSGPAPSVPSEASLPLSPPPFPLPGIEQTPLSLAALQRSLNNPRLKALRVSQLQEQGRFLHYEALQRHFMRLSQVGSRRALLSSHAAQTESLRARHAEALSSLEHRHLCAETDLHGTLELEKRGCDTRLKHMQAYCNSDTVRGMPQRTVTRRDLRQLDQQRHVRSGMDNLHSGRINVLREKQVKQLERVTAKQEAELDALAESQTAEVAELEQRVQDEKMALGREFCDRRERLVRRWGLAEAIERRRLENLGAGELGPLPGLEWEGGVRLSIFQDEPPRGEAETDTERSGLKIAGRDDSDDVGFAHETMLAWDATALDI